jgi:hypothetical protein
MQDTHQEFLELQCADSSLDRGDILGQGVALEELLVLGFEERITGARSGC